MGLETKQVKRLFKLEEVFRNFDCQKNEVAHTLLYIYNVSFAELSS